MSEKTAYREFKKALDRSYATAIKNLEFMGESSYLLIKPDAIMAAYTNVWTNESYKSGLAISRMVIPGYKLLKDPWKAATKIYLDNVAGERITQVWATTRDEYVKVLKEATMEAAEAGKGMEHDAHGYFMILATVV